MRVSGDTLPASVVSDAETTSAVHRVVIPSNPLDLIEVRAPYCALRDVQIARPGRVSASVLVEQAVDLELGDIAAAEAGRHMAILGSVACASEHRDRMRRLYYLAERAVLSSPEVLPMPVASAPLQLEAECLQSTQRQARANCEIRRADGIALFGLGVTYKLVPEKIFQRLFGGYRVDMRGAGRTDSPVTERVRQQRRNPFRQRLELTTIALDAKRIRAELPNIPAEACAGHFPLYPAVPVAVLMEAFSNAGGALLRKYRAAGALRYRVRAADILASKLVFAGQSIVIEGEVLAEVSALGVQMQMRASSSDGDEVSRASFVMEAILPDGAHGASYAAAPAGPEIG
jgi:3-hydroxymyristoyl/3-hydroxydecanoyl-(acyl carrier protein) dehydratase